MNNVYGSGNLTAYILQHQKITCFWVFQNLTAKLAQIIYEVFKADNGQDVMGGWRRVHQGHLLFKLGNASPNCYTDMSKSLRLKLIIDVLFSSL